MSDYLGYLLVGLGAGAVIASLALGLVLTFRASGVVNFAHGAMGMYAGYAYFEMRQSGNLMLPFLGLPAEVHIIDAPTKFTAMTTCLLASAGLGLLVYWLVFRPLRDAPPLARVVASLGLMLYLQEVVRLRVGAQGASVFQITSILPEGSVEVLDVVVPVNRFWLAGIAVASTAGLWAAFRFTRFGLATRAAAESEKGALLLGHSPDRIAAVNWVIASVLAGGAVILIAGTTKQLDTLTTSLLVVPALAAALLGGLSSFTVTTAAGLAIGMAQSAILQHVTRAAWIPDWMPRGGVQQALPFLVILVAITLQGSSLPLRGELRSGRLPAAPEPRRPLIGIGVPAVLGAIGIATFESQWRLALVVSMISALIALSAVVLTGYVGQISLALYAFAGVAGFTTAKLSTAYGLDFPLAPLLGLLVTVAVGLLAGIPAVRVRGMTLAVATIGAAVAIQELAFNSEAFTGGLAGTNVPEPHLFGANLGIEAVGADFPRRAFGYFVLVVLVLAALLVANLRRSTTGRRWLAVRSNERAAAAAGVNVTTAKLSAFAVSSGLAGLGGVMLAYQLPTLSPDAFMVVGALALLAMTYLGGISSISGAVVAGALASGGLATQLSGGAGGQGAKYQFALSGIALIVVAIAYPDGVSGAARGAFRRLRARLAGTVQPLRQAARGAGSTPGAGA